MKKEDAPLVIVGFGNQAKAWAFNLRDSGRSIVIALRSGSHSLALAQELGFKTIELESTELKEFKHYLMLTPDDTHETILKEYSFPPEATLVFAHGYSSTYRRVHELYPKASFLLLAPKSIASQLRFHYQTKQGLGAFIALEHAQDSESDRDFLTTLAQDLGITVGPFETTFEEETKADLFSEQSLLCSLLPYGALLTYKKLREENIPAELAYFECWYELKLIVDALVEKGPEAFFKLITPHELLGGEKGYQILLDEHFKQGLNQLWDDIEQGKFEKELIHSSHTFSEKRHQILSRWEKEELSQVHHQLGKMLFSLAKEKGN